MNALDPSTILMMSMLMAAAMSAVLFSAHLSFPAEVKGLGHWALGLAGVAAGVLSFRVRDFLPHGIGQFLANSILLFSVGLWLIGTQAFYGVRPGWRWFYPAWGAGTAGFTWWMFVHPNFSARVACFSFLVCGFYITQFVLIARRGERHFSSYAFALLMLFQAGAVLTRGVGSLEAGALLGDMAKRGAIPGVYLAIANFMALLLAVAFMAVATRRLQSVLEQRSNQDPLTCVLNRRGFADIYTRAKAKMRRDGQPMTLLSIDLDLFKRINDQFGHAMGDRVLVHVAQMSCNALREIDYVARFGGEEFVVLLPETTTELAALVAARIQASVRAPRSDDVPAYTISIGIASQTTPDENLDSLLMRADAALYRAKANGRDRTEICEHAPVSSFQAAPAMARW
ncbi:MAG TPA: GGDEF domain-containing protein [Janthinobacterium sp.]|nr:GGDEF domain-containing protein [Janthinobacterium sp.]